MTSAERLRSGRFAAVAVLFVASAALAHGAGSAGEPGVASKPARTIEIVMSETADGMRFTPDRIEARRGEQIRFAVRNAGQLEHELVLGTPEANREHAKMMAEMPDMKHSDPNAVTVAPGGSGSLVWRFTHKGDFEFACLIPGHYEAGMRGTVDVK